MHETEKDTAEIDVIAAGINRDAARVVALAEERVRSAHACQGFAWFGGSGDDEPSPEESTARWERQEEIAQQMAAEAEKLRDGAAELQRLAREMRGHLAGSGAGA